MTKPEPQLWTPVGTSVDICRWEVAVWMARNGFFLRKVWVWGLELISTSYVKSKAPRRNCISPLENSIYFLLNCSFSYGNAEPKASIGAHIDRKCPNFRHHYWNMYLVIIAAFQVRHHTLCSLQKRTSGDNQGYRSWQRNCQHASPATNHLLLSYVTQRPFLCPPPCCVCGLPGACLYRWLSDHTFLTGDNKASTLRVHLPGYSVSSVFKYVSVLLAVTVHKCEWFKMIFVGMQELQLVRFIYLFIYF